MHEINIRSIWDILIRDHTCTVQLASNDLPEFKRKLSNLKYRTAKAYPELGLSSEKLYYTYQAAEEPQGFLDLTVTLRDPLTLDT